MKYRTRVKIAIVGVGLMCAATLYGAVYKITKSYPIQYTANCESIGTTKIEYQQDDDDTITTEIKLEPQIVEQESEIEYYKSPINLTEDDRWFIECVVAGECAYEPYEGKLAVAQCYFDAMVKSGLSAREVKEVYQYAGWNPDLDKQNPKMYIEVMDAVHDIFDMGQFVTEKPILFFYAPSLCDSPWHESQNYAMTIGGHKFFYLTEDENAEWANILLTKVNEYGIIEP